MKKITMDYCLLCTSNEYIWSKIFLIFMQGLKSAILAIFQNFQKFPWSKGHSDPDLSSVHTEYHILECSNKFVFFQTRSDTPLLVNIKGCGYPPEISCPAFANHYNEISQRNQTFPCYYSQENPWIVLQSYDFR